MGRDSSRRIITRAFAIVALASAAAACSDDDPIGPVEESFGTLTVDAGADWAFVDLGTPASQVQVADPTSSGAWDIGVFATGIMLNGGAAGPGDVQGYCLCQNENATNAAVMAMSADSERAAFEAVTSADLPADENAWVSDALAPAIDGWWSYDMTSHTVAPVTDRVWAVRTAEGTGFSKFRITSLANGSQQSAGEVTFEFATQTAAGEPFGSIQSLTVDVAAGPVYVDLLEGTVSDESDWDLLFEGYDIRVNGGVSGSGQAGALLAGEDFGDVVDGGELPANRFVSDEFGGVFEAKPWYRYDLQGNHQIWPVYNVYLIRTGNEVYKVQPVSYYRESDGEERHITFRYAPLSD